MVQFLGCLKYRLCTYYVFQNELLTYHLFHTTGFEVMSKGVKCIMYIKYINMLKVFLKVEGKKEIIWTTKISRLKNYSV